jgi:hypothetical protein
MGGYAPFLKQLPKPTQLTVCGIDGPGTALSVVASLALKVPSVRLLRKDRHGERSYAAREGAGGSIKPGLTG